MNSVQILRRGRVARGCILSAAVLAGARGVSADPVGYQIQQLGLTDAAHQDSSGGTNSTARFINANGGVAGFTDLFNTSSLTGEDSWVYSPTTGLTTNIGLFDPGHQTSTGADNNQVVAFNDAGQVAGFSYRWSGKTNMGQDAWVYSPTTGQTMIIGLTDAAHTNSNGIANVPKFMTAGGQVIGTNLNDAWIYSPATGTSSIFGLTGAVPNEAQDYNLNSPRAISSNGLVIGVADRDALGVSKGTDAWIYNTASGVVTNIGFDDAAHVNSGGYAGNTPLAISPSGLVVGDSGTFAGGDGVTDTGVDIWVYNPSTGTHIIPAVTGTPVAINDAGYIMFGTVVYTGNTPTSGYAWSYSPVTGISTKIGLNDATHISAVNSSSNNLLRFQNALGEIAGYADRTNGMVGQDAWVYDPRNGTTYDLFSSQSSTGAASSFITVLADDGTAYGIYNRYTTGTTYTTDAFKWTESTGLVDLGALVSGGLTAAGWQTLQSPLAVNALGQIVGTGLAAGATGQQVYLLTPSGSGQVVVVGPGQNATLQRPVGAGIYKQSLTTMSIGQGGTLTVAPSPDAANRQVVVVPATGFSITGSTGAWTGQLNLTNNDLVITNGNLATVTNQIAKGLGTGNWNGSGGITSSAAAADTAHLMAVGVVQNNQGNGTLYGAGHTFDGITPGAGDVLIKYTYAGDANLDGIVDGSDYTLIDSNFANHGTLTGWYHGDFNYDGVVDGSDYALIDNAFNNQGASLSSSALVATATAQVAGPTAVPEPVVAVVAMVAVSLSHCRRRFKTA